MSSSFRPRRYVRAAASVGYARGLERRAAADYRSRRESGGGLVKVFGALWRIAGRRRTRSARLAPALAVVATLAAVVAATAGALAFDDQRPCPAAYTENERSATPSAALRVPDGIVGTPYAVQLIGRAASPTSDSPSSAARRRRQPFSAGGLLSGTPARSGSWRSWVRAHDLRAPDGGPDWCISADQVDGEFVITVHPGSSSRRRPPGRDGRSSYDLFCRRRRRPGRTSSPPPGCAREWASGSCPSGGPSCKCQLPAGSG